MKRLLHGCARPGTAGLVGCPDALTINASSVFQTVAGAGIQPGSGAYVTKVQFKRSRERRIGSPGILFMVVPVR